MSPREKGRYLRAAGWKSVSYGGRLSWQDPQAPMRGAIDTAIAVARQKGRDMAAEIAARMNAAPPK